ncbi:hypothetical protein [Butyrivibrio fibrisolvens]|uniref:hypothetical protein n=1 Tax=Butyrivibrio fibrisolvens TaxID=831 RepID=UPI00041269BC|nr:hypothetical protein [Butyrivibrio fibrisolvens]
MTNSIMIIWPKLAAKVLLDDIIKITSRYAVIDDAIRRNVSFNGFRLILTQVFEKETWIGDSIHRFKGTKIKGKKYWDSSGVFYVLFLSGELNDLKELCQIIQKLSGLNSQACHITYTNDEYEKAKAFFTNANTMHLIQYGDFFKYNGLYKKISKYRNIIKNNPDAFVIASSTVMELYGIRKSRDIDFLTTDDSFNYNTDEIGNHKDCIMYYSRSIEELVNNPQNYLYIWGVKIISLKRLLDFKENRAEYPKDICDIKLIKKVLEKNSF